jgi:hypothetical protein
MAPSPAKTARPWAWAAPGVPPTAAALIMPIGRPWPTSISSPPIATRCGPARPPPRFSPTPAPLTARSGSGWQLVDLHAAAGRRKKKGVVAEDVPYATSRYQPLLASTLEVRVCVRTRAMQTDTHEVGACIGRQV